MFSIVIPTYNRCSIVINLITNLSMQIQDGDEVIVIDDGSTDETFEELSVLPFEWLRIYKIPNSGGPARPRNIGFRKAKNSWVCFLDSDDWWGDTKLDQLRVELSGKEKNIAFSYHNAIGSKSGRIFGKPLYNKSTVYMFTRNSIVMSSLTINKILFDNHKYIFNEEESSSSIEDTVFMYELFYNDLPHIYISKCLSVYTEESSDSISQSHQQLDKLYMYHHKNPYNIPWFYSFIVRSYWETRSLLSKRNINRKKSYLGYNIKLYLLKIPISTLVLLYTRIYVDHVQLKKSSSLNSKNDSGIQKYKKYFDLK